MTNSSPDIYQKQGIYLDVPHVWQEDPEHTIPESERRSVCAIACMKMVLDYLKPESITSLKLDQIFQTIKNYGRSEHEVFRFGYHPHQVEYLKSLGLISWRRNWHAPSNDTTWFVEHEGYNSQQLHAVNEQIQEEQTLISSGYNEHDIITHSLLSAFTRHTPVIVSVKPGFSSNKVDHQIVLNGYCNTGNHSYFYYLDPELSPEKNLSKQTISTQNFFAYSRYLAIFVAQN